MSDFYEHLKLVTHASPLQVLGMGTRQSGSHTQIRAYSWLLLTRIREPTYPRVFPWINS